MTTAQACGRWRPALILVALLLAACAAPAAPRQDGAGEPTSAPPGTPAGGGEPVVLEYDLGPAVVEQAQISGPRRSLPYQVEGVIAVPAGAGRHPLVIVTHGSHPACPIAPGGGDLQVDSWPCPPDQEQRNDVGWRYLVEALARQGFVAVAPNMNAIFTAAWGTDGSTYERYAAILDTHLTRLEAATQGAEARFGVDLRGRIDPGRTALVGHSQGGGYAVLYAHERAIAARSLPGSAPSALLLVAPAVQVPSGVNPSEPGAIPAPDIPTAVVMGLCDGDVSTLEGFTYFELARAQAERAAAMEVVVPYGANHNGFNAALGEDGLSSAAPGCDRPAGRLTPAQQQAFLTGFAGDFLASALDAQPPRDGWQTGAPAPQRLYDVPVLTALLAPAAQRRPLLSLADGDTIPSGADGASLTATAPLSASVCTMLSEQCPTGRTGIPSVERRSEPIIRLSWAQRGGALRMHLGEGERDLRSYAALQLRVALDGYEPSNAGGQALSIVLTDRAGQTATATVPAETLALQPPPAEVRDADSPAPYLRGVVPLAAVRVPLTAFAGADLGQIESVALLFDQRDRGALYIADLELLR